MICSSARCRALAWQVDFKLSDVFENQWLNVVHKFHEMNLLQNQHLGLVGRERERESVCLTVQRSESFQEIA